MNYYGFVLLCLGLLVFPIYFVYRVLQYMLLSKSFGVNGLLRVASNENSTRSNGLDHDNSSASTDDDNVEVINSAAAAVVSARSDSASLNFTQSETPSWWQMFLDELWTPSSRRTGEPSFTASADEFYDYLRGGLVQAQAQHRQPQLPIVASVACELPFIFRFFLPSPRCESVVQQLIDLKLIDDARLCATVNVPLSIGSVERVLQLPVGTLARASDPVFVSRVLHCWPIALLPQFMVESAFTRAHLVATSCMSLAIALALQPGSARWSVCLASTPGAGAAIGDRETMPALTPASVWLWWRTRHRATHGAAPHYSIVPSLYVAWRHAQRHHQGLARALVLDVSGAQCAGLERDRAFWSDTSLVIFDLFNRDLMRPVSLGVRWLIVVTLRKHRMRLQRVRLA
jgi:hypothetical protein